MSGRQRAAAIAAAAALDAALGDPARFHPVAGFGSLAAALERRSWRPSRTVGALHAGSLVAAAALAAAGLERRLPAPARTAFAAICLWATLGGRSLAQVADALAGQVERGQMRDARATVRALAGRDPSGLGGAELCRAAVESVAENTADAVVGSHFWFAVAGAPAAAAYRAVNTLDAMIGHRSERYERYGWAAARLDDLAGWPAARIGALLAVTLSPLVGGRPGAALTILLRDGSCHPSPNAGRLEAAFAGALGVRLGGQVRYGERTENRPQLGDGPPPSPADVRRAVRLSQAIGIAACLLAIAALGQAP